MKSLAMLFLAGLIGVTGSVKAEAESAASNGGVPVRRTESAQAAPALGFASAGDPQDLLDAWNPMAEMERIQTAMDRLFRDNMFQTRRLMSDQTLNPRTDVLELEDRYRIQMDLPGMEKDKIDIRTEDHVLTISGQRSALREDKNQKVHRLERSFGSFERSMPIPEDIVLEKITAKYEQGILTVDLPKLKPEASKPAKENKILVQ